MAAAPAGAPCRARSEHRLAKVAREDYCAGRTGRARRAQDMMVGEAQIARRQRHANVMPLLASFLHGQELWMVLPLCRCTLRGLLNAAYPRARPRPAPMASLHCCC